MLSDVTYFLGLLCVFFMHENDTLTKVKMLTILQGIQSI